jgi:hypothetical protein
MPEIVKGIQQIIGQFSLQMRREAQTTAVSGRKMLQRRTQNAG